MLAPETIDRHLPDADAVIPILKQHILTDGYPMVLDMEHSHDWHLVDQRSGRAYVDFFSFYAASPLGMNHPKLLGDEGFKARLLDAALNKITNSDIYTGHKARFVNTFSRVGIPPEMTYAFFVEGGALAVENALKVAFDWKVRKNFAQGYRFEKGQQVLHFEHAFHGRSGYTMSLTNTDPNKVALFPKFDWPRVTTPMRNGPAHDVDIEEREELALRQAKQYFHDRKDDIACILIEPIQSEGGDNHFRVEFLQALRTLADENDALLIFDEVQTGVGLTGTFWAWQNLGVTPDVLAFGKKTQVCGILAGPRVDDIDHHVFKVSSRINSTWGGNLVDMVRFDRILEIIEEDDLVGHVAQTGPYLLQRLQDLAARFPFVTNPRGRGFLCAFDLPSTEVRNAVRDAAFEHGLIILGCGGRTLRFRPALTMTREGLDEGLAILETALLTVAAHHKLA